MEICHHFAELDCSTFRTNGASIHVDECTLCFAQATDEEGIDLCLQCFNGSCRTSGGHTSLHHIKTSHLRFLHVQRRVKQPTEIDQIAIAAEETIAQRFTSEYSFRCEDCKMDFPVPPAFACLVSEIENTATAFDKARVEAWELDVTECKHGRECATASLKISALPEKCANCELDANLWLCLICGVCGCGRAQYGVAKGNSHALAHYHSTGHSLAVKMGTLDPADGFRSASCYCYACDDETLVRSIAQRLDCLGFNHRRLRKTEKTIIELNVQLNQNFELSQAFERDRAMQTLPETERPPGLFNIGNSCYVNSLLQAMFSVGAFTGLAQRAKGHIETCRAQPAECFVCQFAKLAALFSDRKWRGHVVKPFMFKQLVGRRHPEFKTERQQDVCEYFTHLRTFLLQAEDVLQRKVISNFNFSAATVLTCEQCSYFYLREDEGFLLNVRFTPGQLSALSDATTASPAVFTFEEMFGQGVYVGEERLFCERCRGSHSFSARRYLKRFPDTLAIAVQVVHAESGAARKLHYQLQLEEKNTFFGLNFANASIDTTRKMSSNSAQFNEAALCELCHMGFSEENSKAALLQAGNNFDTALNLLLSPTPTLSNDHCDERLARLTSFAADLGIEPEVLRAGLSRFRSLSDEELVNLILTDPAAFDEVKESLTRDYTLVAGVVHLGADVSSGHYVAYGRRTMGESRHWLYFNDDKVLRAMDSGFGRSYMLFFETIS